MPVTLIRVAESSEELEQVYRLRYDMYVNELQLDLRDIDHHGRRITTDLDQHATILGAFDGNRVVGTLTMAFGIHLEKFEDFFQFNRYGPYYPEAVSMTSKFAVSRDYRYDPEERLVERLAIAAFKVFISEGACFDSIFFDSGNGRPHDFPRLKRFYERLGYRQVLSDVKLPGFGECHRMVLVVNDGNYLRHINSPLAEYVPIEREGHASVEYFYKNILTNGTFRTEGDCHVS